MTALHAATWPRADADDDRLMVLSGDEIPIVHRRIRDLPSLLAPGDLMVLNDAATIPASLFGRLRGRPIELRLAGERDDGDWDAVLFGEGDWRTRTEHRPAAPDAHPGEVLSLGDSDDFSATVIAVSPRFSRLLTVRLNVTGDAMWQRLYRHGRPVQYAHVREALPLWHVQTPYAARPWAVEMPSAGRALRPSLLAALRAREISLATITHAAGLSATGDDALDAALPLPERYEVSLRTVEAVRACRARGGRVIAVGTSVVRALESAARDGELRAAQGVTDLILGAASTLRVVDGVLTGLHEPGTSHHALLGAFVTPALLERSLEEAAREGYLLHEFGDSALVERQGAAAGSVSARVSPRSQNDGRSRGE